MKLFRFKILLFFAMAFSCSELNAVESNTPTPQPTTPQPQPWWQVATGIVAIPAGLLGLYYTYRLSEKTRFESLKLQKELQSLSSGESPGASPNDESLREATLPQQRALFAARTQDFVIRYIILEIAARAWRAVTSVVNPLLNFGTNLYFSRPYSEIDSTAWPFSREFFRHLAYTAEAYFASFGYIILFISIGWPLLKDICSSLHITPREIFSFKKLK